MDYTSNKLDLSDFTIYRDLSKPVGALNDTRYDCIVLQEFSFSNVVY